MKDVRPREGSLIPFREAARTCKPRTFSRNTELSDKCKEMLKTQLGNFLPQLPELKFSQHTPLCSILLCLPRKVDRSQSSSRGHVFPNSILSSRITLSVKITPRILLEYFLRRCKSLRGSITTARRADRILEVFRAQFSS